MLLAGVLLLSACASAPPEGGDGSSSAGSSSSAPVPCTLEAKLCPDGTSVGRTGPDCAFAPCPGASASSASPARNISDGVITLPYEPGAFSVAAAPEPITVQSYIPACNPGFAYCFYDAGAAHAGTNFLSAGLGVTKRPDLADKKACLGTQPDGYTGLVPVIREEAAYATGAFPPVSDAAAGHYASDEVYRLSSAKGCYEFRARVAWSQFANYPAGTVTEFTAADRTALAARLRNLLFGATFADGTPVIFPSPPASAQ
jgi:hypothetical protein